MRVLIQLFVKAYFIIIIFFAESLFIIRVETHGADFPSSPLIAHKQISHSQQLDCSWLIVLSCPF